MSEEYPEHEKLHKVAEFSQSIGEFLEWLSDEQHVWLAKHDVRLDNCRNCGHPDRHTLTRPSISMPRCSYDDEGEECDCERSDFGNPNLLVPYPVARTDLLAAYFEIDLKVLEEEKQAMITGQRALNAASR